ncbi:MAG: hypothetical protein ABI462_13285 [Ignavibacteria bacterium]
MHNIIFKSGNIIKANTVIIFFTLLFIFSSCGKDNKTDPQGNKTDSTKETSGDQSSFIINYDLQGMMNGTMDILRNGNRLKQIMNINVMGMQSVNTIYIIDDNVYNITEAAGQKFANKTDLKGYNSRKATGETITDFKEFEKFLSGKKVTGSENIIGYNTDIYDVGSGISMSVYDSKYILKIKSPDFMAVANKLNKNPSFASDEFKVPDNIEYKNRPPDRKPGSENKSLDSMVQKLKK